MGSFFGHNYQPPAPAPLNRRAAPPVQAPRAPTPAPAADQPAVQFIPAVAGLSAENETTLDGLLQWIVQQRASDLHLIAGQVAWARVQGRLIEIPGSATLSAQDLNDMLLPLLSEFQRQSFEETGDIDLAYAPQGGDTRFRVNLLRSRGEIGAVMRAIPTKVPSAESLGLPQAVRGLALQKQGLVLVCGSTNSGKSTTSAAIIDIANEVLAAHILTIEDPIEYVHHPKKSTIRQRELHVDTVSFESALRAGLRQDPNIMFVGEIRDYQTAQVALEAAETGHLVIATLHTNSAAQTVERYVNLFPDESRNQVQSVLGSVLQAVVVQALIPSVDGTKRHAAREILIANWAIRSLIQQGKLNQLNSALQTGASEGMQTLNDDLARLVREGKITFESAAIATRDITELETKCKGVAL
ncbi:PilT/PilU family type 4a pilus ATPase [Jonesiaceae bacterium BS-20]|uniref:PilT/PilU family type 4a pilus ATPase n=1 Tax=Jonesiaceae bacterium BS-20 TaxID=3120821 RepID=A0AAU7DYT4_9MICO